MNKYIKSIFWIAIISTLITSCQQQPKDDQKTSNKSKDTAASQNLQPEDKGYADVNGLKMYYEVYGEGKPIVLLHGSYMNIPLNWSHIIPCWPKTGK